VKFLIAAQLPARLARHLSSAGHDAIHTVDLPEGNRTTDTAICRMADAEGRIVMSKDRDFRDSHLLRRSPAQLLIVSTGNITNTDLLALFDQHLETIIAAFDNARLVELTATDLSIIDDT
jgi:predicted nuclease of predicted toxin-antitoxin system